MARGETVWERYPITERGSLPLIVVALFGLTGFTVVTAGLPIEGMTPLAVWLNFAGELVLFGLLAWAFATNWPLRYYHPLAVTVLVLFAGADVALQLVLPSDFDAMYVATLNGLAFSLMILPAPPWAKLGVPAFTVVFNLIVLVTLKEFSEAVRGVIAFSLLSMYGGGSLVYLTLDRLSRQEARRRAEASRALRFQRALADVVFEASVLLRGTRIVEFNRAFQELTGRENAEIHGRNIDDLLPLTTEQNEQLGQGKIVTVLAWGTDLELREVAPPEEGVRVWSLRDAGSRRLRLLSEAQQRQRIEDLVLTRREKEIVALTVQGLNRAQVAMELFISEETVKTHLTHVYGKLGVKNRTEMTVRVLQNPPDG